MSSGVDPWAGMPEPIHDWEGGIYRKSYYDKDKVDSLHRDLKAHYITIERQAETLRLLFGDEGVKTKNLMKIQTWRTESDYWRELQEHPHFSGSNVERIIGQSELDVKRRDEKVTTIEAVKDILNLPDCKSSMNTPDIILGFEEQSHLKKLLEAKT